MKGAHPQQREFLPLPIADVVPIGLVPQSTGEATMRARAHRNPVLRL